MSDVVEVLIHGINGLKMEHIVGRRASYDRVRHLNPRLNFDFLTVLFRDPDKVSRSPVSSGHRRSYAVHSIVPG